MRWLNPKLINFKSLAKKNPKLIWGSLAITGGLLYLKLWLPATSLAVPCPIHALTGLYCPGCGLTRAAGALLQADVEQALRYNAVVFALIPLYLLYVLARKKHQRLSAQIAMALMLAATFAFGILRNIPALDWLAPTTLP